MSETTAICDAITTDLTTNAGLTQQPADTRRYARPRYVNPEQLPLLAVFSEQTRHELETTQAGPTGDGYFNLHQLTVEWWTANTEAAETGGATDSQTVADLTTVLEQILARCKTYASGIPGLPSPHSATVLTSATEPGEGNTYVGRVTLDVQI